MALQLTKNFPSGVSGNYWKIIETNINYLAKTSRVTMALYLDQAHSDSNAVDGIIATQSFDWKGDEFPFDLPSLAKQDPVAIAYTKITQPILDSNKADTNSFSQGVFI